MLMTRYRPILRAPAHAPRVAERVGRDVACLEFAARTARAGGRVTGGYAGSAGHPRDRGWSANFFGRLVGVGGCSDFLGDLVRAMPRRITLVIKVRGPTRRRRPARVRDSAWIRLRSFPRSARSRSRCAFRSAYCATPARRVMGASGDCPSISPSTGRACWWRMGGRKRSRPGRPSAWRKS